jgi:hypothetical protein
MPEREVQVGYDFHGRPAAQLYQEAREAGVELTSVGGNTLGLLQLALLRRADRLIVKGPDLEGVIEMIKKEPQLGRAAVPWP